MRKILCLCYIITLPLLQFAQINTYEIDSTYANNVYWKRLSGLRTSIKPFFDEQVQSELKEILSDPNTPVHLGKYLYYRDSIAKIFSEYGLPAELQLIAFANTSFNDNFFAENGETGMWPLPYYLGAKYGLTINSYVDQRKNLYASTRAAAKSLADLYHIYRDWYFTIAAFRCGPVEMNKAIRMASNSLDYFTAEPFIDYTYRKAFSRYMASLYVVNNYAKHQIVPIKYVLPVLDTVCTPRTFTLQQLADATRTPISLLVKLNYEYKKQIVPSKPYHHCFTLPANKVANFYSHLEKLAYDEEQKRIKDSMARVEILVNKFNPDSTDYQVLVVNGKLTVLDSAGKTVDPDIPIKTTENGEQDASGNRWVFYTVKKGDALYLLADLFDATVNDIKRWNKLHSNTIQNGQRLKFLVPANQYSKYSSINRMSASQKQKVRKKD